MGVNGRHAYGGGRDQSGPGSENRWIAAGVGTGGASTKIAAAKLAVGQGVPVVLTSTDRVAQALAGEPVGTWFEAAPVD